MEGRSCTAQIELSTEAFRADAGGAELAGRPSMVAALRKLQATTQRIDASEPAVATLKISNRRSWMKPFSTHPD